MDEIVDPVGNKILEFLLPKIVVNFEIFGNILLLTYKTISTKKSPHTGDHSTSCGEGMVAPITKKHPKTQYALIIPITPSMPLHCTANHFTAIHCTSLHYTASLFSG